MQLFHRKSFLSHCLCTAGSSHFICLRALIWECLQLWARVTHGSTGAEAVGLRLNIDSRPSLTSTDTPRRAAVSTHTHTHITDTHKKWWNIQWLDLSPFGLNWNMIKILWQIRIIWVNAMLTFLWQLKANYDGKMCVFNKIDIEGVCVCFQPYSTHQ